MLIGYYEGFHWLDLLSSFRSVAWTSLYSWGTQADPLILSLSHFRDRLLARGVNLDYPSRWQREGLAWPSIARAYEPLLLVVSGRNSQVPMSEALHCVERGSNLVVFYSQLVYALYGDECREVLRHLDMTEGTLRSCARDEVAITRGRGRILFVDADAVSDIHVEPGPFGPASEHLSAEQRSAIDKAVDRITTYAAPCINVTVSSMPQSWPRDETLVFEIELRNLSVADIDSVGVELRLAEGLEPLASTTWDLGPFRSRGVRTITGIVVPRLTQILKNPITVALEYDGHTHLVYLLPIELRISANLADRLRSSKPGSINIIEQLSRYERYLQPFADAGLIIELLEVDPDAMVAKVRRVGEHIAKTIARRAVEDYSDTWTFELATRRLYERKVISAKSKGYIDTVRLLGNVAAHAGTVPSRPFTQEEALIACYALVLFLREVTESGALV